MPPQTEESNLGRFGGIPEPIENENTGRFGGIPEPLEPAITVEEPTIQNQTEDQDSGGFIDETVRLWDRLKYNLGAGFDEFGASQDMRTTLKTLDSIKKAESLLKEEGLSDQFRKKTEQNLTSLNNQLNNSTKSLSENIKQIEAAPMSDYAIKVMQSDGFEEGWEAFKEHPLDFIAEVGSRSAVHSLPSLGAGAVGALAGPYGASIAAGAASGDTEYNSGIMQAFQEAGVDLTDPNAISEAVKNTAFMDEVKKKAAIKAAIVGAFDGASFGLASKTMAPQVVKSIVAKQAINLPAQMITQASLGGLGEGLGQLATTGEVNAGEVIGEMAGEFVTAPVDVATAVKAATLNPQKQLGKAFGEELQNQVDSAEFNISPREAAIDSLKPSPIPNTPQEIIADMESSAINIDAATTVEQALDISNNIINQELERATAFEEEMKDAERIADTTSFDETVVIDESAPQPSQNIPLETTENITELSDERIRIEMNSLIDNAAKNITPAKKEDIPQIIPDQSHYTEKQFARLNALVDEESQRRLAKETIDGETTESTFTDLDIVETPVDEIKQSDDLPQFKPGADTKGVVEELGGKFDRTGVSPIQIWIRENGDKEVVTGRHRLDLAQRSGEETIPAQYHYESEGFDVSQAASLDALLNIREGQGKVKDYVDFIKNSNITEEKANAEGILARTTGKRAFAIATKGSEALITSHKNDQITDEGATRIANAAPNEEKFQAVGIKAIQDGKSISVAENMVKAVRFMAEEGQQQTNDIFGFDDSAIQEAEVLAKKAAKKQSEIQKSLSAIQGASKRPELAAKEGVNVKDPEALTKRITELKAEKEAWNNWHTNPDLVAELKSKEVEAVKKETTAKASLELKPETEESRLFKEIADKKKADKLAADDKKKADKIQADKDTNDFVLSGSDSVIDQAEARGQESLFDQKSKTKPAKKESNDFSVEIKNKNPNVKFSFSSRDNVVTLDKIIVPEDKQGSGIGTKAMKDVISLADKQGKTIALTPTSDFGGNKKRLAGFYKDFGFVENKGENKNFEISETMYRLPAKEGPLSSDQDTFFSQSRLATEKTTTTNEDVQSVISDKMETIDEKLGVNIKIIPSADINNHIESKVQKGKLIKGFVKGNNIYLVSDHLSNGKDVAVTLAHELIGHVGTNAIIGDRNWGKVVSMYRDLKKIGGERFNSIQSELEDRYGETGEIRTVKEFIAIAAERNEKSGAVGKFLSKVKAYFNAGLRALGFKDTIGMSDIDSILMRSQQYIEGKGPVRGIPLSQITLSREFKGKDGKVQTAEVQADGVLRRTRKKRDTALQLLRCVNA